MYYTLRIGGKSIAVRIRLISERSNVCRVFVMSAIRGKPKIETGSRAYDCIIKRIKPCKEHYKVKTNAIILKIINEKIHFAKAEIAKKDRL